MWSRVRVSFWSLWATSLMLTFHTRTPFISKKENPSTALFVALYLYTCVCYTTPTVEHPTCTVNTRPCAWYLLNPTSCLWCQGNNEAPSSIVSLNQGLSGAELPSLSFLVTGCSQVKPLALLTGKIPRNLLLARVNLTPDPSKSKRWGDFYILLNSV